MTDAEFIWHEPQNPEKDVQDFIDTFRPHLSENQIQLIEHFKDNIAGFSLIKHDLNVKSNTRTPIHEVVFEFEHPNVKVQISIYF